MAISRLQLITFFVFGFLLSNSIGSVTLDGCNSDEYCAGETVWYNCSADNENIQIVLSDTDGVAVLNEWFNDTSAIGEMGSTDDGIWYNKTSNTSIRVWFTASMAVNGFVFECSDVENETDIETMECTVNVNSNVPAISSFDVEDAMYCYMANYTWQITGDDSCLLYFVVRVTPEGNSSIDYAVSKSEWWSYVLFEGDIMDQKHCLSVAPRTAQGIGAFSSVRCVTFTVPTEPQGIRWMGDFQDNAEEVEITIRWMRQDASRPNVMKYYLAANITETDDGDDGSSSGDGDDGDEMNEFQTYTFNGDVMMSDNFVGIVGKTYTVRLFAENCFGNSTVAIYSFTADRPTPMPTTTTDMTETMSPSASPTPEDGGLATYIIVIIAVVGGILVAAIVFFLVIMICCCVCGGALCCAACQKSKKPHDFEMSVKTGTRL